MIRPESVKIFDVEFSKEEGSTLYTSDSFDGWVEVWEVQYKIEVSLRIEKRIIGSSGDTLEEAIESLENLVERIWAGLHKVVTSKWGSSKPYLGRIAELEGKVKSLEAMLSGYQRRDTEWQTLADDLYKAMRARRQVVPADNRVISEFIELLRREYEILLDGAAWQPTFTQIQGQLENIYQCDPASAPERKRAIDSVWELAQLKLALAGYRTTLWEHLNGDS